MCLYFIDDDDDDDDNGEDDGDDDNDRDSIGANDLEYFLKNRDDSSELYERRLRRYGLEIDSDRYSSTTPLSASGNTSSLIPPWSTPDDSLLYGDISEYYDTDIETPSVESSHNTSLSSTKEPSVTETNSDLLAHSSNSTTSNNLHGSLVTLTNSSESSQSIVDSVIQHSQSLINVLTQSTTDITSDTSTTELTVKQCNDDPLTIKDQMEVNQQTLLDHFEK